MRQALPSHSGLLSALQEDVEKMLSQKKGDKNNTSSSSSNSSSNSSSSRGISEEMEVLRKVLSPASEECSATGVLIYRTYTNLPFQVT